MDVGVAFHLLTGLRLVHDHQAMPKGPGAECVHVTLKRSVTDSCCARTCLHGTRVLVFILPSICLRLVSTPLDTLGQAKQVPGKWQSMLPC